MRNFFAPITFSALLFVVVCLSALTSSPSQNLEPSPASSPSPTLSPSSTQAPSAQPTPSPVPTALNFHQWGSITLFNGLPSDSIRAIAQTPDGVMWFGTDNGLARFDGRRIQNFSLGSSDANRILALNTHANGELWVGTRAGAFVHSNNGFEPVENSRGMAITAIVARGHDIWRPGTERDIVLGTESGLVLVVRRDENGGLVSTPLFTHPITSTDGTPVIITGLIQTDHGGIFASTSGRGVFFVDEGIVENESTLPARSPFVNAIVRDSNLTVWLGVDAARGASGIFAAEPDKTTVRVSAPTSKVLTLVANDHGTWAGTERYGLFNFVDSKLKKTYTFANTSGGLRSDTIYTLFTDREGVLWVGTNRGVSRFDPSGAFQETVSDTPNSNFVRTFYRMGDVRSYAGTNRGLFVKGENRIWTEVPALKNKVIYAITTRLPFGQMIVGTSEGVFDTSGKKLFDGDVRGFASLDARQYAAVYGRGVVDITGSEPRTVFADETVTSVCNVVGDRFWIGTAGHGLFSFDGKTVKSEAGPDVLKSGTIWNMFDTREGTLYVAGQHGVLTFRNGTVEQIIAAEEVRDVFSRDGQIWAATTTRGVLHAHHDDRFGWLASSIGFEQGMPSEKAFLIRPNDDDDLTIATNRGMVRYKPGTIAPKLIAVRVLSQRLHDPGEIGSMIELDYPQNSLQIEVAGQSSRTFPEEFQYAFVLTDAKGKEMDRRVSNESQYAPTDLSPGEYVIEATAFNRDLLASEPLTIRFSIAKAPFPWTATALGILLVIALIAFVWAMIERRHIALRNSELAAARFDLANEAERERSRIARDLHDQTLADLRNLLMMSDRLSPPNAEFRSEIESVSTEIRRICEDLSPSVLENVGLVAALEFLLSRSVQDHRFSTSEDANELIKFPVIEQLHIYRIAQEILTNINRHSDATHVEMSVVVFDDGRFLLTIRDNGSPFSQNDVISKGRGISNIRSRANIINAEIEWNLPSEGGNLFTLQIARN